MALFPKKIEKDFYPEKEWVERQKPWDRRILRQWIYAFFSFCIDHKRSFYWSWDRFMLSLTWSRSPLKRQLILDIPLHEAPYQARYIYPIGTLTLPDILHVFIALYEKFLSSTRKIRNVQASTRPFLSFTSFVSMCFHKGTNMSLPLPEKQQSITSKPAKQLVNSISKTLKQHDILPRDRCLIQQVNLFSIPELFRWLKDLS